MFTASVGNLEPGAEAVLTIRYVALSRFEGEAVRLSIPMTVSPRYTPADAPARVGEPDAEKLNPERRLDVPYGLTLTIDVDAPGGVRQVESPTHPIRTRLRDGGATVELSQGEAALDRDFVLLVEPAEPYAPTARVASEEDGTRVAMVTFHPQLDEDAAPPSQEVVFVLDCSGSMQGTSIEEAKRALALCVRTLEEGDTFNVVRFGSRHESLWKRPKPFGADSLTAFERWLGGVGANLGGTEILAPLEAVVEAKPDPERARQVLILTDGQVSNEAQVVAFVEEHRERARVFTFGIGAGASEFLVRGLARAGRGASEMIAPGERIEPKVLRTFNRLRTPCFDDVALDWGEAQLELSPSTLPPVFAGDAMTVFARVTAGHTDQVVLTAGGHRWEVPVDLERAGGPEAIPVLWARHRIEELERGVDLRAGSSQRRADPEARRRRKVVELGTRYGLASSATSWVAVETRDDDSRTTEQAQLRKIPIALTHGWGGRGGSGAKQHMLTRAGMMAPQGMPMAGGPMPPPAPMAAPAAERMVRARAKRTAGGIFGKAMDAMASVLPGGRGGPPIPASPAEEAVSPEPSYGDKTQFIHIDDDQTSDEDLLDLLAAQAPDGSWSFDATVRAELGATVTAEVEAAIASGESEPVAVTGAVLEHLEWAYADRRDEWIGAARKARRWLDRQVVP